MHRTFVTILLVASFAVLAAPTAVADPPEPVPCLDGPTELCVPPTPGPDDDLVLWLMEDVLGFGPCACDPEPQPW